VPFNLLRDVSAPALPSFAGPAAAAARAVGARSVGALSEGETKEKPALAPFLRYACAVIGHETLDRIRRETDIVALIGESLKLSKRGRSHVGLCPFHKEKTPSFHVNAERGFYHCFGCHESGDAIKFLQKLEGLDFVEAVRRLAERAGIEIVE